MRLSFVLVTTISSLLAVVAPFAQQVPQCDFSSYPSSFSCSLPPATPTLAPTITPAPTPVATDTPVPIPTAVLVSNTPVPTPQPAATPIPGGITSIAGVPLCGVPQPNGSVVGPVHDPTKWHALVERDASGAVLCTYGHDHGSDPSALDSVLGPIAQLPTGQEVAFPWVTGPHENLTDPTSLSHQPSDNRPVINGKHAFFKWETLTPQKLAAAGITGCPPNANALLGFDNIRLQVHADANAGADIRFHSFFVQAQECSTTDPTYHGQLSIGGWFDYGVLNGTHQGSQDVRVPLPTIDPCAQGSILANGSTCPYVASRRTHGSIGPGPTGSTDPNALLPGQIRSDFTWYGSNFDPDLQGQTVGPALGVTDGIREEDWGPVDPNNPSGPVQFYVPNATQHHDHGWGGIDILSFTAPPPSVFLSDDPATLNPDGTYDWHGWVNVHGYIQSLVTCSTAQTLGPSTTCIPAALVNMRAGYAQFSNDISKVAHEVEDVTVGGVSLIGYPN